MSTDPERPIEKLLRASAKERRDRAGTSWKIHPATRRLLQQEVSQRLGQTSKPSPSSLEWLLRRWWLRPLGGLAAVTLLVLTFWLAMPSPKKSETLLARNDQAQSPSAVRSTVSDNRVLNALASDNRGEAAKEPAVDKAAGIRHEETLDTLRRESSITKDVHLAPALPSTKAETSGLPPLPSANLPGPSAVASGPFETRYGLSRGLKPDTAAAPAPAPIGLSIAGPTPESNVPNESLQGGVTTGLSAAAQSPSPAAPDLVARSSTAPGKESIQYGYFAATQILGRQKQATQQAGQASSGVGPKTLLAAAGDQQPTQILVSFRVEQSGRELRVIDSDGSIYAGPVQTAIPTVVASPALGGRLALVDTLRAAKKQAGTGGSSAVNERQQGNLAWAFQVVGTNRMSQQRVVFSGTLTGVTNVLDLAATNSGPTDNGLPGSGPAAGSQANFLFENARVSGKAVIGRSQEIQIEAVTAPSQQPGR